MYTSNSESINMLEADEVTWVKQVNLEALDGSRHKEGQEGGDGMRTDTVVKSKVFGVT